MVAVRCEGCAMKVCALGLCKGQFPIMFQESTSFLSKGCARPLCSVPGKLCWAGACGVALAVQ
jgi:hypothetical protein